MLKIPKRLIVGYQKITDDMLVAVPTEIRISKRTKKSAFKIENEKSWEKKVNDNIPKKRINNEFRTGFQLLTTYDSYRSTSANPTVFYVWHPEFDGHIALTPDNLFQLIQTCTIEKNTIKDELIFDGASFITQETMDARSRKADNADANFKALKKSMEDRKIFARDMKPGYVYQVPPNKNYPSIKNYIVLIGTIENDDELYYITKAVQPNSDHPMSMAEGKYISRQQSESRHYIVTAQKQPTPKSVDIPDIVAVDLSLSNTSLDSHLYKGVLIKSAYPNLKYRKTLPSHYIPEDDLVVGGVMVKDINMLRGYNQEDYDSINHRLKNHSVLFCCGSHELCEREENNAPMR